MPVLVTAADTPLGSDLVRQLLGLGGEVRAYASGGGGGGQLRSAGAIVATGDLDDEGRLEAACEQVHTVVHLGGGLLAPSAERLVADAATVATATANAGVRRVIVLSTVGASEAAADPLRRAKAVVEELLAASAPPSVALRVPVVASEGLCRVLSGTPLPPDVQDVELRSVRPADVVALLVALDEMRGENERGHATLVAQGDAPQALGRWIEAHRREPGTYVPLDTVPLLVPGLTGPWTDGDDLATDAWGFTGVDRAAV